MLVGLSGYLAGYNGSFEFKSGEKYPEELNYVFMRVFNAGFGILCVPLMFYTARTLKFSNLAVYLVTLMVLCGTPPSPSRNMRLMKQRIPTQQLVDLFSWIRCCCSLLRRHCFVSRNFINIARRNGLLNGFFGWL